MLDLQPVGGDIFAEVALAAALCVPVNAKATPGAGLARAAAVMWPKWAASYRDCCRLGRMVGAENEIHTVPLHVPVTQPDLFSGATRVLHVVSLPTKYHWREPSSIELVMESTRRLCDAAQKRGWQRVAVPALGCGLGGLSWSKVLPLLRSEFADHPTVFVVYPPQEGQ